MLVPLVSEHGAGATRFQLLVRSEASEVTTPAFPGRPGRLVLNAGEGVLAEVPEVKWQ